MEPFLSKLSDTFPFRNAGTGAVPIDNEGGQILQIPYKGEE